VNRFIAIKLQSITLSVDLIDVPYDDLGLSVVRKCYMCDRAGTTREHVPPDAFFPEGHRINLWTVRSCPEHNLGNSKDVEYVFALIVNQLYATGSAHAPSQRKVFRAFDKSEGLFRAVFKGAKLDATHGLVMRFNLPRFKAVMRAIAYGVYHKTSKGHFGGAWRIICPNLSTSKKLYRGIPGNWDRLYAQFQAARFDEMQVPDPEVFRCAIIKQDDESFIFRFIFYNGFTVYAWAVPA
jgi:hypothetical protein